MTDTSGLDVFGVWVTSKDWRKNPRSAAVQLASLGVRDAYLVINDNSHRGRRPGWHIFGDGAETVSGGVRYVKRLATLDGRKRAAAAVVEALRAYAEEGIRPHLLSWIRADKLFLSDARDSLDLVYRDAGDLLASTQWDAEESWLYGNTVPHTDAASYFGEMFSNTGSHSITPIASMVGSGKIECLTCQPIVDAVTVQAYATATSRARPGYVQDYALKLWRGTDAAARGRYLYMGLPLYKQEGAGGLSAEGSMRLQLGRSIGYPECRGIVWWASWDLTGSKRNGAAASFLRGLKGG